jgi:hypothetical protein
MKPIFSFLMELPEKLICMIRGTESTLFVLPSEVGDELGVKNDDTLKFVIRDGTLVISKIDNDYLLKAYGNQSSGSGSEQVFE